MSKFGFLRKTMFGAALAMVAALPAAAQTATFNGSVNGIGAGTLQYSARESGGQYATSFAVRSGGLAGLFGSIRFDGEATGRISGSSYSAGTYRESSARGDDRDSKEIRWSGNTPRVVANTSRTRSHHASASSATGHVDPATAVHILFQNRNANEICTFDFRMFDGARRSRISASGRSGSGNTIQCNGTYSRVAGFSNGELERGRNFPFTLTYQAVGGGVYQLQSFDVRAVRGRMRFTRR